MVRSVVGGLTLNAERAAAAASGLLLATDVADYLVGKGMPFRRAHEVVGALVRKLIAEKRDFETLSLDEWRAASELCEPDVIARVTPAVQFKPSGRPSRRRRTPSAPVWPTCGAGWTASPTSANMSCLSQFIPCQRYLRER